MLEKEKIQESVNELKSLGISEDTAKELAELFSNPPAPIEEISIKEISIKETPNGVNKEEKILYSTNNKNQKK